MSLKDTLGGMNFTITAERVGAKSAEGAVLLQGPNDLQVASEELQISRSTGDLVLLGPTVVRTPAGKIDVTGGDARMKIDSDGNLIVTSEGGIVFTKPQE